MTGSIVFHAREGDFALEPGDRLEIDPGAHMPYVDVLAAAATFAGALGIGIIREEEEG